MIYMFCSGGLVLKEEGKKKDDVFEPGAGIVPRGASGFRFAKPDLASLKTKRDLPAFIFEPRTGIPLRQGFAGRGRIFLSPERESDSRPSSYQELALPLSHPGDKGYCTMSFCGFADMRRIYMISSD